MQFILYSSEFKQIDHLARYTDMTLANFTKYKNKIGQVTYATIMVFFYKIDLEKINNITVENLNFSRTFESFILHVNMT